MSRPEHETDGKSPGSHAASDPPEPTDSGGSSVGPALDASAPAEGGSKPDPGNAAGTAASDSEPQPEQLVWCPNCELHVKKKGRGHCPGCGRMLAGSFL